MKSQSTHIANSRPAEDTCDLSVALFADSHFRSDASDCSSMPGPAFSLRERTEIILQHAREHLTGIDLVVHNGDVVDKGDYSSYQDYDQLMVAALPEVPVYYNAGNHDLGDAIPDLLRMGPRQNVFQSPNKQCFTVDRDLNTFIFVDGTIQGDYLNAEIGAEGREWLASVLQDLPEGQRLWLFTHFPLFRQSELMPERNALQDGSAVHDILLPYQKQIGAVFSAHVHRLYPKVEIDGIPYISLCPASTSHRAGINGPVHDPAGIVGYHELRIGREGSFDLLVRNVLATHLDESGQVSLQNQDY